MFGEEIEYETLVNSIEFLIMTTNSMNLAD